MGTETGRKQMIPDAQNPLSTFFRLPGMAITLPSKGAFTPEDQLSLTITGELEVFPMTAKDEVWSKNPDGLLNGSSVEHIIKSCVPGIKNPRKLPAQDIDYILLAIKKVTYGDKMQLGATCPKCGTQHDFECSIDEIMSSVTPFEGERVLRLSDELILEIRPYDYHATTRVNIATFEEAKLFQALGDMSLSEEERVQVFSNSFNKIKDLNVELLSDCISSITARDLTVTNPQHIREWLANSSLNYVGKVEQAVAQFKSAGLNKQIELECPKEECQHVWKTDLIFDPGHFFE
jgi:T4 bacteriophage base plate protein